MELRLGPGAHALLLHKLLVVILRIVPRLGHLDVRCHRAVGGHVRLPRRQCGLHLLFRRGPDRRLVLRQVLEARAVLAPEELQDCIVRDEAGIILHLQFQSILYGKLHE